ncbi:uncharacterized protein P174DRAFT_454374 [Aspergillus novofumigatus IBT 16806]|uniref:Zn(2)-C6 fungal-type domain-containing protein n=1 Tax=Aspergillus novofumigatus (strain IBT 16806) TaxID=1392255 RepID=A0A2I1BY56_ASPN1|nr:uncharacterized protein P174DRAFT_454374 [Aspergillus novofumigatus IBT 16806]PKX90307.1 hypothetical protein P174DRAFT_454374 [Aspergillus novofumigatus IBT 16806]
MAHPYYPSGDEVGLSQQSGHEAHSISLSTGPDGQQEMVERGTSSVSPALEIDGRSRNSTRRRIQVACNRCRKRKIKCSGDIGDGQGCSNCRASGNKNCQFLRVNSSMLQTKDSGWPYHASNATVSSSPRLGVYAHMAQRSALVSTNSLGVRLGSFSRPSGYDLGTFSPQHPPSRQTFSLDHTANYENEPTAYNPPSSYMFSSSHQGIVPDYCGLAWNTKAWNSNVQVNNAQSGAAFPTQDTENTFTSSSYPFLFSGPGTQSTDVPMTCTPSDGQGADRTLPKASGRSQLQMGMSSPSATPEAMSGLLLSPEYRYGHHLATRASISGSGLPSMQHGSNGNFGGNSLNQTRKASQSSAPDMMFDYLPITSVGTPSHLGPSAGTALNTFETLDSTDDFRASEEGRSTRSFSRDSGRFMSMMGCGSDIYGYSSSEKSKNRSETGDTGSTATLMNGLPYTRPRQADTHSAIPFDLLATEVLPEYRASAELQRTSVSALSNPGGF